MARWTRYNIMWSSLSVTATGRWFSPGPLVFSTNKTEILLKVALNTITLTLSPCNVYSCAKTSHGLPINKPNNKTNKLLFTWKFNQVRDNISFKYQYSITFYFKATSQQVHTLFVFKWLLINLHMISLFLDI